MSGETVIDSLRFAHLGGSLSREVEVRKLERLQDSLHSPSGSVRFTLRGEESPDGEACLRSTIEAELELTCQRCMAGVEFPLRLERTYIVVAREEDLPDLQDEDDDVDVLVGSSGLDVLALVEDEILLALPLAPRHENCQPARPETGETGKGAFAALAALRKH